METLLIVLAGVAIVAGILGSFLPFLPGPPLAWAGLLMLHFTARTEFSTTFLVVTAVITVVITALDYLLPIWTAKRSGGTKYGQRGATIGMILGLFAGPLGIILGPLIGAFVGELIHDSFDWSKAKRAAWNSFVGFLLSTGIQLGWCLVILFWYVREVV
jgi:uncharacterized protein